MIRRLKTLEVQGFRSFQDSATLDLNADVVLIYGKNGSGKTSLVSALEMAITGNVYDLSRFESDYPRCLHNVKWQKEGSVKLALSTSEKEHEAEHTFDGSRSIKSSGYKGSLHENRFFSDRCYLSQSKLSRLLEMYQAPDGPNSEQLVVRFVRELLGLDVLENLTAGLYEAGDVRRLESACDNFSRLRREDSQIAQTVQAAKQKALAVVTTLNNLKRDLETKIKKLGDPFPSEGWDQAGISKRLSTLSTISIDTELTRLREIQGKISQIKGYVSQTSVAADATVEKQCQIDLAATTAKREALAKELFEALNKSAQGSPEILDLVEMPSPASGSLQVFANVRHHCQRVLSEMEKWSKEINDGQLEVATIKSDIEAKQKRLDELQNQKVAQSTDSSQRQLSLLSAVVEHIIDDRCPICKRDYLEVKTGSLKSMVEREIQKLGGDIKAIEAVSKQQSEIKASLLVETRKRETAEEKIKNIAKLIENQKALAGVAQNVLNTLDAIETRVAELLKAFEDEHSLSEKLADIKIKSQQIKDAQGQVEELGRELKTPELAASQDINMTVEKLLQVTVERVTGLESRRNLETEIASQGRSVEAAFKELKNAETEVTNSTSKQTELAAKLRDVDNRVEKARRLARAAASAKTKLLDQVFNDTLNRLWSDLYNRLAKSDDFIPQLSPPILTRGRIETHISGTMNGVSPFHNFSAVSSLGNLNTAALSLFLALNLVEVPKHHVLVLDDPVQNMDDLHVIQFAALLRAIAFQAGRQLVIAVHEKALFDYLALELGPSRKDDTLNLISVYRDGANGASRIENEKRLWKPDKIEFGAKPALAK